MNRLGLYTAGDLRQLERGLLLHHFGKYGYRLYDRARGIDERPVEPDQPVQSISSEDTFETDLPLDALAPMIERLAEKTWLATRKTERVGRTVLLKLKTSQFRILTRSFTPDTPPASQDALTRIALALRDRVDLPPATRYRLVGVGIGGFRDREELPVQAGLFSGFE